MNINNAHRALLVCFIALIASPAWAGKGMSQSYADVGYLHVNGDDFDIKPAGNIDGVFSIFDFLALRGGFTRGATDDFPGDSPDFTEFRGGIRPYYNFTDKFNAYADIIRFNNKLNGNQTTESDKGVIYAVGIRYQLFKRGELNLAGEYRGGDLNKYFIVMGPTIKLTKKLSLTLRTSQASGHQDYFGAIRFDF